jgi:hypothetical protein
MKDHIPLAQLQETLSKAGKYTISMESPADTISETSNEPPVKSVAVRINHKRNQQ